MDRKKTDMTHPPSPSHSTTTCTPSCKASLQDRFLRGCDWPAFARTPRLCSAPPCSHPTVLTPHLRPHSVTPQCPQKDLFKLGQFPHWVSHNGRQYSTQRGLRLSEENGAAVKKPTVLDATLLTAIILSSLLRGRFLENRVLCVQCLLHTMQIHAFGINKSFGYIN